MALDTREKRSNSQRVGRAWMRGVHPTGTIDEQERIAIGNAYGGNVLTPTAGGFVAAWANGANQIL